ncbi:RNA polymerase I-specific transcription initiation factor Rrn6p [[Candida] railenensis]|uniref:RNA polymerase I-specific transcription initiation factor Rrn6p n=1 Tax=[Candida] railenensis TaxID=45579 RepID=A0A9P0VZQ4_9ASCO|nr:RNA polymerase I-specific transcription initiation factor Rrn6p [[Candida] railenensis]
MWPQKEGLGAQLSYGVKGNGIIRHNSTSSPPYQISFPRQNTSPTLYRAVNSEQTILPVQTSDFDLNSSIYKDLESIYVPEEILKSYLVESKSLTSPLVYDPTKGDLFQFHDLRMKKGRKYEKVLAYVSGETGTILNIANVKGKEKKLSNGNKIYLPQVSGTSFQVSLSEPIKQIQFSKLEETFDYIPSHLIIRTDSTVYILNCLRTPTADSNQDAGGIELTIIDEIHNSKLYGQTFADISFNPWDYTQFAAVDVKGNFGIWNISTNTSYVHKLTLVIKDSEIIPDLEELSNWKKISWAFNRKNILIATRSSLTQVNLGADIESNSSKLITSNSWSKVLDFKQCSNFAFLLTSKELIWLQWNKGKPSRILSWKHFLDEKDPSFKLKVTRQNGKQQTFLLIVFSQIRSLLFVFTFGMKDGVGHSLHDPYYIRTTTGLQQVELNKLDPTFYSPFADENSDFMVEDYEEEKDGSDFGIFELRTNLNLTFDVLTSSPDVHVVHRRGSVTTRASLSNPSNTSSVESSRSSTSTVTTGRKVFKKLTKADTENIVKTLNNTQDISVDTVKQVQDYAFKLGNTSSIVFPFTSLMDISSEIPQSIDDIAEFDLMVNQLSNYYEESEISIVNFINPMKMLFNTISKSSDSTKKTESVENLSSLIGKIYRKGEIAQYNNDCSIRQTSILIGGSLLRARRPSAKENFDRALEEEQKETPSKLNDLLSGWESIAESDKSSSIPQDQAILGDGESARNWGTSQMTVPDVLPTLRLTSQTQPTSSQRNSQKQRRKIPRVSQLSQLSQSRIPNTSSSQVSQTTTRLTGLALSSQQKVGISSQLDGGSLNSSQSLSQSNSQKRKSSSQGLTKKKKKGGFA